MHYDIVAIELNEEAAWRELQARSEVETLDAGDVEGLAPAVKWANLPRLDEDTAQQLWRPRIHCSDEPVEQSFASKAVDATRSLCSGANLSPAAVERLEQLNALLTARGDRCRPTGKVVGIVEKVHKRVVVGTLQRQVRSSSKEVVLLLTAV